MLLDSVLRIISFKLNGTVTMEERHSLLLKCTKMNAKCLKASFNLAMQTLLIFGFENDFSMSSIHKFIRNEQQYVSV